jgi:hypothetical protein
VQRQSFVNINPLAPLHVRVGIRRRAASRGPRTRGGRAEVWSSLALIGNRGSGARGGFSTFRAERALPSSVFGPRDRAAFFQLARAWLPSRSAPIPHRRWEPAKRPSRSVPSGACALLTGTAERVS